MHSAEVLVTENLELGSMALGSPFVRCTVPVRLVTRVPQGANFLVRLRR